jgi:hypothetical protein
MKETILQKAAIQFGKGEAVVEPLGHGLIHRTYRVKFAASDTIVLQCINQAIFKQPENIIQNYRLVEDYLRQNGNNHRIPALLPGNNGKYFWTDEEGNLWRATAYIQNTYTHLLPADINEAIAAAACFAGFTNSLQGLDNQSLHIILPCFHDLAWRYQQFEDAVKAAHINRLLKSTHIISEMRDRQSLVGFYNTMVASPSAYPIRIMHHDCKLSNVLFDINTKSPLCPVDLDTVMPGHYFSDIGDMIRTMACTEDENSVAWELLDVKRDYYHAIVKGYMQGIGERFTEEEKKNIHLAGVMITFMQCLRYVTDFLNNDIYYQTTYPEQNLNRALNQLILLERLEDFIKTVK